MANASIAQPCPQRRKKAAVTFGGSLRKQEAARKCVLRHLERYARDCERNAAKARRLLAAATSVDAMRKTDILCKLVNLEVPGCQTWIAEMMGLYRVAFFVQDVRRFLLAVIYQGLETAIQEAQVDVKRAREFPNLLPDVIRAKISQQDAGVTVQGSVCSGRDFVRGVVQRVNEAIAPKRPTLDALSQAIAIAQSAAGIPDWSREPLTDHERKVRLALLDGAERDACSAWGKILPGTVFRRIGITNRLQLIDDTPMSRDDCDHLASDARERWRLVYDRIHGERQDARAQEARRAIEDATEAVDRGEYDDAA